MFHAVLHGLLGLSYLGAGLVAAVFAAVGVSVMVFRSGSTPVNLGGAR
jgi:hypothetical protein